MLRIIGFTLIFVFLYGCRKERTNVQEYSDGKDTLLTGYYLNGKQDGPFIQYYPNKAIRTMYNTVLGKIEGITVTYYQNGQLQSVKSFKNNKRYGRACFLRQDGSIDAFEYYLNDTLVAHGFYYDNVKTYLRYKFNGYYNHNYFVQTWDRSTGKQSISGNTFIDYKSIIVDTAKNETRIMTAKPLGKYKLTLDLRFAINRETYTNTELIEVTDFGEYVFHGNILDQFTQNKIPLIFSSLTLNDGTQMNQDFFIRKENVKYYVP